MSFEDPCTTTFNEDWVNDCNPTTTAAIECAPVFFTMGTSVPDDTGGSRKRKKNNKTTADIPPATPAHVLSAPAGGTDSGVAQFYVPPFRPLAKPAVAVAAFVAHAAASPQTTPVVSHATFVPQKYLPAPSALLAGPWSPRPLSPVSVPPRNETLDQIDQKLRDILAAAAAAAAAAATTIIPPTPSPTPTPTPAVVPVDAGTTSEFGEYPEIVNFPNLVTTKYRLHTMLALTHMTTGLRLDRCAHALYAGCDSFLTRHADDIPKCEHFAAQTVQLADSLIDNAQFLSMFQAKIVAATNAAEDWAPTRHHITVCCPAPKANYWAHQFAKVALYAVPLVLYIYTYTIYTRPLNMMYL